MLPLAHVICVKHKLQDPVEQNRTILKAVSCGCSDEEKNDSCKSITEALWLIRCCMLLCVFRKGLFLVISSHSKYQVSQKVKVLRHEKSTKDKY